MRDIAAVMITVDRSPGPNYLAETLENLKRGGLLTSKRLFFLALHDSFDTSHASQAMRRLDLVSKVGINGNDERRCANLNAADALSTGARSGCPWVLFLEDDIDVCADFFDGVGAWLDDHAREDRRIYAFGANYHWVEEAMVEGRAAADYPIGQFYGTQAIALRSEDAADLAVYLAEHRVTQVRQVLPDGSINLASGSGYDILMTGWALKRWPEVRHFLTSAPSMVQHVGRTSAILPREGVHTFPSWPGREWSYLERRAA